MMIKKLIVLAAFLTATGQEVPSNPNNLLLRGSTGEVFTETDKQDDYGFDFENERLEQLTCKALNEKCREPWPNCCDGQCYGAYRNKKCQCVGGGTKEIYSACSDDSQCCSGSCSESYQECWYGVQR